MTQDEMIEKALRDTAAKHDVTVEQVLDAVALTESQRRAVDAWWAANDPDGTVFNFVDNDRYANPDNPEEVAAYEKDQKSGCCGSVDEELTCDDGTELLFGFNYDH